MAKKKKIKKEKEVVTENVRLLTDKEVSSFRSWMQERRQAIGEDILNWLEFEEIEQIEAVIFNGLVDAFILGGKQRLKYLFLGLPVNCKIYPIKES